MAVPALSFVDRVIFLATSGGTAAFTLSSALTGYQTMTAAGAVTGAQYGYAAQSGDLTQWEVGYGAWSGTQLARTVLFNSLGTTSAINFTNPPIVMVTILGESLKGAPIILQDNNTVLNVGNLVGTVVGGSGYGGTVTYTASGGFPFTGGTGSGGTATSVTVTAGVVTAVTPANARGSGYTIGDVLSIDPVFLGADPLTGANGGSGFQWTVSNASTLAGSITAGGTSYGHTAIYRNVSLTGGSGSGATADFLVVAGVVSFCSTRPVSSTYVVGDVLSASNANLGGAGSGFTFTITAIGSDTIGTGSTTAPFATGTAAFNSVKSSYQMNGHVLNILFADGVYPGIDFTAPLIASFTPFMGDAGRGRLQFQGNRNNMDAVVIDGSLTGTVNACFNIQDYVEPILYLADLQIRNATSNAAIIMQFPNVEMRLFDVVNGRSPNIHMRYRTNTNAMIVMGNALANNVSFYDQSNDCLLDYTDSTGERSAFDIDGLVMANIGPSPLWGIAVFADAFLKLTGQVQCIIENTATVKGKMFGTPIWAGAGSQVETFGALSTLVTQYGNTQPNVKDGGLIMDSSSNPCWIGGGLFQFAPFVFSKLPSASSVGEGYIARITDSTTATIGATITGGGTNHVMGLSDGTNWRVMTTF